jgi:hypothetical protein
MLTPAGTAHPISWPEKEMKMAGPIYELWMSKPTEAFYALSKEEQDKLFVKNDQALAAVSGKTVIGCVARWATDGLVAWGVEEYPDFDAAKRHGELLQELNWRRYFSGTVILGIRYDAS